MKPVLIAVFCIISSLWLYLSLPHVFIDHDEVEHAHASWLISAGKRPLYDFQIVHPPYFWIVYAPLLKVVPQRFESLLLLRHINALFGLMGLLALFVFIAKLTGPPTTWVSSGAAVLVMFFQPPVIEVLSEFRMDQLVLLLMLSGGLAVLRGGRVFTIIGGALMGSSVLIHPRLALAGCFILGIIFLRKKFSLLDLVMGAVLAFAAAMFVAFHARLNPLVLYRHVFLYQMKYAQALGGGGGLSAFLGKLLQENLTLVVCVFLGLGGMVFAVLGKDKFRMKLTGMVFLLCAVYVALVPFPFKQYLLPVFLFWSIPVAIFFEGTMKKWPYGGPVIMGVVFLSLMLASGLRVFKSYPVDTVEHQIAVGNELIRLSRPGSPVAAQPPIHPIFRFDSTYYWTSSVLGDQNTDALFRGLQGEGSHFSFDAYLKELRDNPPGLIVVNPRFAAPVYLKALEAFLSERHKQYKQASVSQLTVFIESVETKPSSNR